MMTKVQRFRPVVLYSGSGILALFLFFVFSSWAYDDPFITFRYAQNLRAGLGFVYNPGERILSTTTPLYTLLLAGLSFLWSDLPRLSTLISALSLGLGTLALYWLGQRWDSPMAGLAAALLYPLAPLLVTTFGAETCFYVMLILWAFALYAGGQDRAAMVLAALATLTRADGVLAGAVIGLALVVRERRIPWKPLLLFGLLIAPWYLFSWFYFGSPFPVTLVAKQHQAQMAISDSFAEGFIRMVRGYAKNPLYWLHGVLLAVGLGYALRKARRWLLLLGWGLLYFFGYTLLGVSRYFWYYAPMVPVFVALIGLGGEAAVRFLMDRWRFLKRLWPVLGSLILLLLLLPQVRDLWWLAHHPDPRVQIYRDVGLWLAENTPPEASVGTLEVGIIGYYARRRMVDFAGLIQPDVALQMRYETTYEDTAFWAVRQYRPNFLVLNPAWFPRLMEQWVNPFCEPLQRFTRPEYFGELVVYRCR
jgi:MFS family permease